MIATKFVKAKLESDPIVATLCENIQESLPTQDTDFPCISISVIEQQKLDATFDHAPTIKKALVKIDYFIRNHNQDFNDELEALGVAIDNALDRYRGTFNGITVLLCKSSDARNEENLISDTPDVFFDNLQYEITTRE